MKKSICSFILLMSISANASSISLPKINSLIRKNRAGWVAKENIISQLSDNEIKRLLGSNEEPKGNSLFETRNKSNDSFDWRNVNGVNWLGPVMNQGNCGSCVAFAAVATLEATYRINSGLTWLMPSFSPQQLFNCGGGYCDFGWQPSTAASMLKNKGVVDAACAPYESGSTGQDVQCKKSFCQNQEERTYKIVGSTSPSLWGGSAEKVKAALKKGPLVTTLTVYEDFLLYSSGIYKSVSNNRVGGHAVSLVGFNDEQRYWIVRNSWGSDWGENGFVRISYDDKSGIAESTWAYQTAKEESYVSIESPTAHEYISGEKTMSVVLSKPGGSQLFISGENELNQVYGCLEVTNTKCEISLDSTRLKDGRYEIYAQSNTKKSQTRDFLIINHPPQSSVAFKGAADIDLKKSLKGRVEFDIDVKSSPVIPQKIIFIVEDLNGKIVSKRETDEVFEQMKLGFRTNTLANGQYKMYYQIQTPYNNQLISAKSNIETVTIKN